MNARFETPKQLLQPYHYVDPDWYERECRALFDQAWTFACAESELAEPGDFATLQFMDHPLFVVRDAIGELRAFHNICRHRGCAVLEGAGNTGSAIMCPYHRWTYLLDGALRGVPNEEECFGEVARERHGLKSASVGVYRGLVFVNPSPVPRDDFATFIAGLDVHGWPHVPGGEDLAFSGEITYEMHCNWKVFYENAIDGYHLGYLHDQTLGKVYPSQNIWVDAGRNVVWYSTERDGPPQSVPLLSEQLAQSAGAPRLAGHETSEYPGVVMLFPLTIVSPSPWGLSVSLLEPKGPEVTMMRTLGWAPGGTWRRYAKPEDPAEPIRLRDLEKHPLESGNFQLEDMWIVEKIQRSLHSPNFEVGPLAAGDGAEGPLMHFQKQLLEFVEE